MALTLQDRYSRIVDAKLRATLVQRDGYVWNKKYEGDPKAGAVKVPVRGEATVVSYDKANGAAKSYTAGSFITIAIDKDKAVNEILDGYDASAVPDNIVADRLDAAGYGLALAMNADGTAALLDAATVIGQSTATSKSNIYDRFVDAKTKMSKAKVPAQNRWALVNPDTMALVLKSPEFIAASALGDEVKQSGAVGRIAGFLVFEDATLPDNASVIFGHPDWCCRVDEWAVDVKLQSLDGSGSYIGASAIQGRKVYAHKVTNSAAVLMDSAVLIPTIEEATAGGTTTITITGGTNTTSIKYRKGTVSEGVTTWGDWTTYNGSSKPTAEATDIIEAYGIGDGGVRSGVASHTVTAS